MSEDNLVSARKQIISFNEGVYYGRIKGFFIGVFVSILVLAVVLWYAI